MAELDAVITLLIFIAGLLVLLLAAVLANNFYLLHSLSAIHSALCRQNIYLLEWRQEFELAFDVDEDGVDIDEDEGDEEQEMARWN